MPSPAAFDLRQDLIDDDVVGGGLAQRGVETLQELGHGFRLPAHQSDANRFADGGECRTRYWRDLSDGELTVGSIEESLDMLEALSGCRGGGCF